MEPHSPKPVMDVSAPPKITLAPSVPPATSGSPLPRPQQPVAEPADKPAAAKQPPAKPGAPVGVIVVSILAMMALSTLAVIIYISA